MYEGQVPGRADSPAHHIEHLEAVLHLLSEQRFSVPASVTHLDLRALIASGIPIDLPGGKQLIVAVLKEKSPCVGKPMDCWSVLEVQEDIEIVALFRKGETVLPRPELKLQARDRLLIIASPQARQRLAEHFNLSLS